MVPTVHQQITINARPAVILSVDASGPCWSVAVFWPSTPRPPVALGAARSGAWHSKCAVLLYHVADRVWHLEVDTMVNVTANLDPGTCIDLTAWLEVFARACHASVT